jgi:hypothetical protein
VQTISIKDATLAVAWPGARIHPWTPYVAEPPTALPEIDFMRRRLRRIFTAFRWHSRGKLVRLAAKIDHSRITKDARGVVLLDQLVTDRILTMFDAANSTPLTPTGWANSSASITKVCSNSVSRPNRTHIFRMCLLTPATDLYQRH